MQNFASFISNGPEPEKYVKVAIIDDGVERINADHLSDTEGVSFDAQRKQWFFSSRGHGTLMAGLVRAVCPRTHLRIARLDESLSREWAGQPTVASATKVRALFP
jgi:hypothetical protein